jgi:hypothetical protein
MIIIANVEKPYVVYHMHRRHATTKCVWCVCVCVHIYIQVYMKCGDGEDQLDRSREKSRSITDNQGAEEYPT